MVTQELGEDTAIAGRSKRKCWLEGVMNLQYQIGWRYLLESIAVSVLCMLWCGRPCRGYSVIMHEAIIDAEWDDRIRPFLLERFPDAKPEQLRLAKSYAYGGSVIQDMGYYPLGGHFFSHLTHYVRSGDFVQALLEESKDINDYAFALGALSHYCADIQGHSLGINLLFRCCIQSCARNTVTS